MSQWTHVNAIIRYDSMVGWPELPNFLYDLDNNTDHLPEGSEGPLHINIWTNPHRTSAAQHTVSIWGDLRGYGDGAKIFSYFNRITNNQMIRAGLLEIDVEGEKTLVYNYIFEIDQDGKTTKGWKLLTI